MFPFLFKREAENSAINVKSELEKTRILLISI